MTERVAMGRRRRAVVTSSGAINALIGDLSNRD